MKIKGIAYYPEHWEEEKWDKDLKRIKEMGVNTIRIGEFMWSTIEPKEGEFSFKKLDLMVKVISDYGFNILIGTPSATFPSWVVSNYSNILAKDCNGRVRKYGTRRQYCYNSKDYLRLSKIVTKKVVERYSDRKNVIGFQVDNEIGHEGSDFCQCDNCLKKFRLFVKEKYNNISNLNKICGNIFWGQEFNSFDEIPIPFNDLLGHNPTLRLDYARFMSKSLVNYGNELINVVKEKKDSSQKVTTNLPGGLFNKWFNPNDLVKNIDFVSFDNYPIWGGETKNADHAKVAMELDMIKGLKNRKFWIVEELIGAQGHDLVGWLPRPNQAKLWAMQAHLRGAENIFFFRYKGLNKGEEQFCQGIFDVDDRLNSKFYEVKDFFDDVSKKFNIEDYYSNNKVALIYDYENIWSWRIQPQSKYFDFSKEFLSHYRAIFDLNVNVDVISINKDLEKYEILVIPSMQIINDKFIDKVNKLLKMGKTIVFGYRSGIRNKNNNMPLGKNPIEDIIGAQVEGYEALDENSNLNINYLKKDYEINIWRDILKVNNAKSIIKYNDYGYSNNSCVIENEFLNGKTYYLGSSLPNGLLRTLYKSIFKEKNIETKELNDNIELVILKDNKKNEKEFYLNHGFTKINGINPISYI